MNLRILYQDDSVIAVDKPAGFHVHPPEDPTHRIPRARNCVHLLHRQAGAYVHPVHRLDVATSGVLLFAKGQRLPGGSASSSRSGEWERSITP